MKLVSQFIMTNQNQQFQFGVELEVDDCADVNELNAGSKQIMKAINSMSNEIINLQQVNTIQIKERKQLPTDKASPKQMMFLESLLKQNNYTMKSWCKEQKLSENEITAAHCKEWIQHNSCHVLRNAPA